ncbi:family 43 glycosylhydrolase [Cellulomonas sp. NPDC089187]|uniref:glycoside hydrolase family 43 protein n=1 Tax=Cellulomonas sp. NPDC089187 TaxID=3154970 RepID=UPI003422B1A3
MRATNPVLSGCFPDPSVCRVGEWFYLVNSTFEYLPGLPIHRSRDLVHWEPVGHAVTDQLDLSGLSSSQGLFAPTLRHHDGRFWLVCTLVGGGGHLLLTAEDAAGPWSAPTWLTGEGIDPSLFFDEDGRVWFHATRPAADPQWPGHTEIWLRELVDGALVGPEHVLWSGAVRDAVWSEGPHLYRVDGHYYLLTAEGGTERHHAVVVARAEQVIGPYVGTPANPVLTHRHLGAAADIAAVGHADLVQAPDDSWWALLLGVRPYGGFHHNLGRETFLVPVVWEDGWPVFSPGEGRVPREVEVPFASALGIDIESPDLPTTTATPTAVTPTGPVPATSPTPAVTSPRSTPAIPPSDPAWCAPRHLPSDLATPEPDGWLLPVRPTTLADTAPSSFLGLRQQHIDCELVVTLDLSELAAGEWAGLAVRQSESDHLTLLTDGVEARTDLTRHGTAIPLGRLPLVELGHRGLPVPAPTNKPDSGYGHGPSPRPAPTANPSVTVALRATGQDYTLLAGPDPARLSPVATADGRSLDSVSAGGFLGLWLGPYATSAGRPATGRVRARTTYRALTTTR